MSVTQPDPKDGVEERLKARLDRERRRRQQAELIAEQRTRELHLLLSDAQKANERLQAFSETLAHAMRTPTRVIHSYAQILADDFGEQMGPEAHEHVERLLVGAHRVNKILDGMQSVARVYEWSLSVEEVDISALASEAYQRIATDASDGTERAVELAVEPGLVLGGDSRLLGELLYQLMHNAWRFTWQEAQAHIEVGAVESGFYVRDNGVGFDPSHRTRAFGFFQVVHPLAHEQVGVGIGLTIANAIAERHHGAIRCETAEGEGTTFTVVVGHAQSDDAVQRD